MHYKELDDTLMKEFCDKVEALKAHDLKNAASIRTLADIASVLTCLWHPAVKEHFETKETYMPMGDKHNEYSASYLTEPIADNWRY